MPEQEVAVEEQEATIENQFNDGFDDPLSTEEVEPLDQPDEGDANVETTAPDDEAQPESDDDTGGYTPSDDMLEAAHFAGISSEEAGGYSSGSALARAIAVRPTPRSETEVPPQREPEKPPAERFKFNNLDSLTAKDEDGEPDYDKGIRALPSELERMNEHYAGEMDRISKTVQSLQKDAGVVREQQRIEQFDSFVNDLGDEYKDVFGKGKTLDMNTNSSQFKNRQNMADIIVNMERGQQQGGVAVSSLKSLLTLARNAVAGDKMAEIQRKKISSGLKKRSKQFQSKPTQREGSELGVNDAIAQKSKAYAREHDLSF